jgi:putative heme-binding domain-containing protein
MLRERLLAAPQDAEIDPAQWKSQVAASPDARVSPAGKSPGVWLATADFDVAQSGPVQLLASASGKFQVWLNGQFIYRRDESRAFQPDSDRLEAELAAGRNRLVLQLESAADAAAFHVRFRRKSAAADSERLMQAALKSKGDPGRGREVFFSAQAQCSKCHRVGDAGERVGPELTGVGGRFSKIHIIESILEPSRTVTPGFQSFTVRLLDGRVLSGVRVAETRDALTIADQQGQKHVLPIAEIDVQQPAAKSTMPDNLAQQLSQSQFLDLIAFLTAQREAPAP